jgi:hypothetical protein
MPRETNEETTEVASGQRESSRPKMARAMWRECVLDDVKIDRMMGAIGKAERRHRRVEEYA